MFSKKKIVLICAVVLVVLGTSIWGVVYAVKQKQKEKPSSDSGKEKKAEGTGTAEEPSSDSDKKTEGTGTAEEPSSDNNEEQKPGSITEEEESSSDSRQYSPAARTGTTWRPAPIVNNQPDVVSDGLPNLGNTCYANTAFQTLYRILPFRELAKKKNNKPVLKELGDLFLSMEKKAGEREKKRKLENIKRAIGDNFKTEMKDAGEFMIQVLEKIEENIGGTNIPLGDDSEEFGKIFHININKGIVIPILENENTTVQTLLEKHMLQEKEYIRKTPEVLILQIPGVSEGKKFETSREITREGVTYSLSQVGVFTGQDNAGHYYLLAKTENNTWKKFSDMRERSVGEGEVFGISPNHKQTGGEKVSYLVYTKNSA
ncbi:MAG: ubiquitin carboxyl-terminal hydrolase [Amphiamblys sp. WSBS2006]|nr:MAG: ubiquitin carboxyl-terminal hydrolase [Amphiamblys sp. WSBS2006]